MREGRSCKSVARIRFQMGLEPVYYNKIKYSNLIRGVRLD